MAKDPRADELLDYWFGPKGGPEWGKLRKLWFGGGPAVDEECRTRFGDLHVQADAGDLEGWRDTPEDCLALVILLDQFSRNLHRGTWKAFASDAKALALARHAIEKGWDQQFEPVQRWFLYLPFEHAEDLRAQHRALELFSALPDDDNRKIAVDYAQKHLDVIAKFGRFPHRNEMLGRPSTPEETKYLAEGGARFG
ncbi:MAG TPA: DUF924 family protein [Nannocystaceae bacterium]|nr:DUF924 family protein [Nannocystaceae bacterium]